jgi:hypothetical protein
LPLFCAELFAQSGNHFYRRCSNFSPQLPIFCTSNAKGLTLKSLISSVFIFILQLFNFTVLGAVNSLGQVFTTRQPKKKPVQLRQTIFVKLFLPKSPDFEEKNSEITIFWTAGSSRLPKCRRIINYFELSSLDCSQIWLIDLWGNLYYKIETKNAG